MTDENLKRKLKMERIQACLNCQRFVDCDDIGKFEECSDFEEIEKEVWVIKKIKEIMERGWS
jgi:hypothetical protein